MSQVHAPMTDVELLDTIYRTTEELHEQTRVWHESDGWCSACRAKSVPVVLMGLPDRYVGICAVCIEMLNMELRAMVQTSVGEESK